MGNRLYWADAWFNEDESHSDHEQLADKKQLAYLDFMLMGYFDYDPVPEKYKGLIGPEWHNPQTWKKFDELLPQTCGPEGFAYPYAYWGASGKLERDGDTQMCEQEMFLSLRPIIKRIADSGREVSPI